MNYSDETTGDRTELSGGLWYHDCQRNGSRWVKSHNNNGKSMAFEKVSMISPSVDKADLSMLANHG